LRETADARNAAQSADRLRAVLSDLGYAQDGEPVFAQRLAIRDRGKTVFVACEDIDWIEAAGDYLCIHVGDETHILRETMKAMSERLDPTVFQRVHRSAIVNLHRVKSMESTDSGAPSVQLRSGAMVRLGRNYRSDVREALRKRGL
jgi:two-component system LytT family response regulator